MAVDEYLDVPAGHVSALATAIMKVDMFLADHLILIKNFYISWVPGWLWNRLFRKV